MKLLMKKGVYDQVSAHVKKSYPHECCGVLAGTIKNDVKHAVKAYPVKNLNQERAHDRYNMDPVGMIQAEKEISSLKLEIVGIYHSHPDHPPRPSKTDFEFAWPVYSYIIFAIAKGEHIEACNWCLNDTATEFVSETYELTE